jgi:predicted branched-subunit amino acid permease
VSFAFGIQATNSGLTSIQAILISLFNVTSAGQLAGLQLMVSSASLIEMMLTQLTINAANRQAATYDAQLTGYGEFTVGS